MPPCSWMAVSAARTPAGTARAAATAAASSASGVPGAARWASHAAAVASSASSEQVGAVVLHGLERADRAAELLPLLDVGDGHVEARVRDARGLGGGQGAGEPPRDGRRARDPGARRRDHGGRAPGRVEHPPVDAGRELLAHQHVVADHEQHDVGEPAAGHEVVDDPAVHLDAREADRADLGPVGERGQQLRPPRLHEDRGRQHAGQERPRRHHAAQLLQHHGELRQPRALAAVLLGHVQPEPAEPGDLLPRGGHRLVGGVEQGPRRGALPGEEEGAGHLGQRAVVVGDRQGHGATTSRSRRGPASRRTRGRPRGRRPRS